MPDTQQRGLEGLQRIADSLSDGVVVCKDGAIVWANRRMTELVGRSVDSLLGERPESLLPPEAPAFEDEIETVVARPDGQTSAVRVARMVGAGGPGTTWIFRDISRTGDLEQEIGALGHALRDANHEIEALRERVRRQRVDLDEVLTIVSHELRTPVTVVTGYARLLLSEQVGDLNEEQRKFVDESLKSCRRMNTFIANLLENSRNAGSDAPLQVHEASVAPTLEGVLSSFKPIFDEHGISTRLDLHPDSPPARFDPLRVEQVLSNLLENAIKYARSGGQIVVATRPSREKGDLQLEISVADRGPGVEENDRERIFERYVRVGEQSHAGGLGLGLSICRRAVEAHGGVIGVTDTEGGGARFWFTLPAAEAHSSAQAVPEAEGSSPGDHELP